MAEWEIDRPSGQCFGSSRSIGPGEEYFAVLVETEQGLERRDFCLQFWQEQKPEVYCYWKTKFPDPQQKKQIFVDDEMLMTFFGNGEKRA